MKALISGRSAYVTMTARCPVCRREWAVFFFLPQQVVDYDLANLGWVRLIKRREMEEGRLAVLITAAVLKRYNHTESKANSLEDDQHSQHDFL